MKFCRGKKESPGERREEGKKWGSHRRHLNCFIWQRLRSFLPLFPSLSARLIISLVKLYVSDGGFYMVFFIQARPNKIMQHCRIGVQLVLYVCILLNGRGGGFIYLPCLAHPSVAKYYTITLVCARHNILLHNISQF